MLHRVKVPVVVVELANWVHELGQAPQLGQNHPRGLSADHVEDFRQVYEDGNDVHILFDALLLHLANREVRLNERRVITAVFGLLLTVSKTFNIGLHFLDMYEPI